MDHGHRTAELRSLAYHRIVAERLQSDPELLDRARARVESWLAEEEGGNPIWARRWQEVLGRPLSEIAQVLTADDEQSRDLRQSTPFAGALTNEERWRIVREVRADGKVARSGAGISST